MGLLVGLRSWAASLLFLLLFLARPSLVMRRASSSRWRPSVLVLLVAGVTSDNHQLHLREQPLVTILATLSSLILGLLGG